MVVGNKCDPADGSSDVNPQDYQDYQDYQEKIRIAFSEPMSEVTVYATDPKFPFTTELNNDIFTIRFADGYEMPKGTSFTIWLIGKDLAGIDLQKCRGCNIAEYSFTTIKN